MNREIDKPTEITADDIDKVMKYLMISEMKPKICSACCKENYTDVYGHMFSECDECYFKRFPNDEVEAFCRSFF